MGFWFCIGGLGFGLLGWVLGFGCFGFVWLIVVGLIWVWLFISLICWCVITLLFVDIVLSVFVGYFVLFERLGCLVWLFWGVLDWVFVFGWGGLF